MNTKILIILLLFILVGLGITYAYKTQQHSSANSLVLGTMSGWPPYVSMNEQGEYEGFDIVIAQEIARRLNKKLEIKDMDTSALIAALKQGKVDFIMTGLDITHERLQHIAMIPYEGTETVSQPLVFWQKIPAGVQRLEDLKTIPNALVCVEPGSSQESFLLQYKDLFEIKSVSPAIALLELKKGKALAVLLQKNIFEEYKKKFPELVALEIPLDEKNKIFGNGIGVKKENTTLIQQITDIITDLKRSGHMARLEQQLLSKAT